VLAVLAVLAEDANLRATLEAGVPEATGQRLSANRKAKLGAFRGSKLIR
jgi:hypothetical protein